MRGGAALASRGSPENRGPSVSRLIGPSVATFPVPFRDRIPSASRRVYAVAAARSLIRHRGRVLVGDAFVTGMGMGTGTGRGRAGGEGGATERGWWKSILAFVREDSGLSCQVQLRWPR